MVCVAHAVASDCPLAPFDFSSVSQCIPVCVSVVRLLCVYCVYGVQEVLNRYTNNNTVKMNQSATTLRVYDVRDGSLPWRMGSDVISYGLSDCINGIYA